MTNQKLKSIELYYKPPKDEYFEELKRLCIRFWEVFDDGIMPYDERSEKMLKEYRLSKINKIKDLQNEGCNFSIMVQMIHQNSRKILAKHLSLETRNEISMRLYGFNDNEFDPFNIWNPENCK